MPNSADKLGVVMQRKLTEYAPYFVLALFMVLFTINFYPTFTNAGRSDWDQFCFFNEAPRHTLFEYGQFPLWNPYSNGGRPLLADPQVGFMRPTFIFPLIFGCVVGLKIEILFLMLIGLIGMFILARYLGTSSMPAVFAAAIYCFSSYFSLHLTEGHVTLLHMYLLPWIFLFFNKSFENRKYSIISGTFLAAVILSEGAVHALVPICLFLGLYSLFQSIKLRTIKPITILIIVIIIAAGVSAVKLVPMIDYIGDDRKRLTSLEEKTYVDDVHHVLFNRDQRLHSRHLTDQTWGWHEYGAYVGIIAFLFALIGVIFFWKKEIALLLTGIISFGLILGNVASWAPWPLLHLLPIFESMHVPSRYVILLVFAIALFAALGTDRLLRKCKKSMIGKSVLMLLILLAIIDIVLVNMVPFGKAFDVDLPEVEKSDHFKQIVDTDVYRSGSYSSMHLNMLENKGTMNGYNPIPHYNHARDNNHTEYKGEVYVEPAGFAEYEHWSPNKLKVKVTSTKPGRVVINQNYDSGWRVGFRHAEEHNGLISAQVPSGDTRITFYYLPSSFILGILITISTILGIITYQVTQWPKKLRKILNKIPHELKYVLMLFIITRVALTIIGIISRSIIPLEPFAYQFTGISWLDVWGVWDAKWYTEIATGGYSATLQGQYANYAFFPLYPLVISIVNWLIGNAYITGLIISNVCLILAAIFMYRLFRLDSDKSTSLCAIKYLFIFPTAYMFSGVLSESLFLLLVILCFYFARKEKWWLVGVTGFLLTLTRSVGILLLLPIMIEYMQSRKWKFKKVESNVLWLLLFPLALGLFTLFLYNLTGDFLAYSHIMESGSGHHLANPFTTLWTTINKNVTGLFAGLVALTAFSFVVLNWKQIRLSYFVFAIYSIIIPLATGVIFGRMGRYVAVIFPLYLLLASYGEKPSRDQYLMAALAILQGGLMVLWSSGTSITL